MYVLQEYLQGWNDIYSHQDYNYLLCMKAIFEEKYPHRRYRVLEVIEDV